MLASGFPCRNPLSSHPDQRPAICRVRSWRGRRSRRTQGLTSGGFFASISAFLKNLVFVDEAPFASSHP